VRRVTTVLDCEAHREREVEVPLEKHVSSNSDVATVVFHVPPECAARTAELFGDFTDWSPLPMDAAADGGFEIALDLPVGDAYRFRYRLNGEQWVNDWAADAYVSNEYGSEDSVVEVRVAAPSVPSAPATREKAPAAKKPAKKRPAAKRVGSASREKSGQPRT
jgi:1,4-alpha-glucan branching enzyme